MFCNSLAFYRILWPPDYVDQEYLLIIKGKRFLTLPKGTIVFVTAYRVMCRQ